MNILFTVSPKTCLFHTELLIESKRLPLLHHLSDLCDYSDATSAFQRLNVTLHIRVTAYFFSAAFSQLNEPQQSCSLLYLISFLCLSMLKSILLSKEIWRCVINRVFSLLALVGDSD